MKKIHLLLIITGILFSACFKPVDAPPLMFDGEANMSIAEFQKLHELGDKNPMSLIDTNAIITGIVTSTDQFGSCYKEIFFQDTTGGLSIRIANTSYYAKYRIGQRIFVKAKGLYLGNYVSGSRYGFYQIGLFGNDNGGMEYISASKENQHIFRSNYPEPQPKPKIIKSKKDIVMGIGGDYHTLVILENCSFTQANGKTKYFEPSGTSTTISRPIQLSDGTTAEARISAYCSFANDTLPVGTLNITGLLTMFGNNDQVTHQIIIRSINDVEVPKILHQYDMNTDPLSQGWAIEQKKGTDSWNYSTSGSTKSMRIQGLSGDETECWLISPKFNLQGEKNVEFAFTHRILNGTGDNAKVFYTTDNGVTKNYFESNAQGGIVETVIKLDDKIAQNPNLQFVFQYETTDKFPTWLIYNIAIKTSVN